MVAFDIYLAICHRVDKKIRTKLGYDTPHTRLIQQCPPCFFKLQGEPDLEFSVLVTMDGNNSLKRVGATPREHEELFDSRTIDSNHWIGAEEVNHFKDEVAQVRNTCFTSRDQYLSQNRDPREVY